MRARVNFFGFAALALLTLAASSSRRCGISPSFLPSGISLGFEQNELSGLTISYISGPVRSSMDLKPPNSCNFLSYGLNLSCKYFCRSKSMILRLLANSLLLDGLIFIWKFGMEAPPETAALTLFCCSLPSCSCSRSPAPARILPARMLVIPPSSCTVAHVLLSYLAAPAGPKMSFTAAGSNATFCTFASV